MDLVPIPRNQSSRIPRSQHLRLSQSDQLVRRKKWCSDKLYHHSFTYLTCKSWFNIRHLQPTFQMTGVNYAGVSVQTDPFPYCLHSLIIHGVKWFSYNMDCRQQMFFRQGFLTCCVSSKDDESIRSRLAEYSTIISSTCSFNAQPH